MSQNGHVSESWGGDHPDRGTEVVTSKLRRHIKRKASSISASEHRRINLPGVSINVYKNKTSVPRPAEQDTMYPLSTPCGRRVLTVRGRVGEGLANARPGWAPRTFHILNRRRAITSRFPVVPPLERPSTTLIKKGSRSMPNKRGTIWCKVYVSWNPYDTINSFKKRCDAFAHLRPNAVQGGYSEGRLIKSHAARFRLAVL